MIVYPKSFRKPIWDRVCRSVFTNGTDDEWNQIIEAATNQGLLPEELCLKDLIEFNERGSNFSGTVNQFLNQPK
jgi:hypothetical protein